MYSIQLAWKEVDVYLPDIDAWIRSNGGDVYCGNSADTQLTLWFSTEPSQEFQDAVRSYWDGITESSSEATRYLSIEAITSATESLKTGLLSKSWDEMSVAERKLVIGQTPTREELGL